MTKCTVVWSQLEELVTPAMFSFHKPKIYRSALGCCICRAKSSSSRFTDSKKYEPEFARCFRIVEEDRRSGEICNACVLLVKRWKKLPPGTTRDWHHVSPATPRRFAVPRPPQTSAGGVRHARCRLFRAVTSRLVWLRLASVSLKGVCE